MVERPAILPILLDVPFGCKLCREELNDAETEEEVYKAAAIAKTKIALKPAHAICELRLRTRYVGVPE